MPYHAHACEAGIQVKRLGTINRLLIDVSYAVKVGEEGYDSD